MHKFYSTRGGTITLADDVSWSTNTGFSQINTPIWVSIDLNGHSHKTIQYSSIRKPCTKGMLGELDCALPHVPIRDAPTKNKNKHACCFCSRKLSSHWNSAAIAPIEILLNLCSAFASLKLGSDSPLALSPHLAWPLFCYDETVPDSQNTLAACNDDHLSWLNRCPPSGGT